MIPELKAKVSGVRTKIWNLLELAEFLPVDERHRVDEFVDEQCDLLCDCVDLIATFEADAGGAGKFLESVGRAEEHGLKTSDMKGRND